MVNEKRLIELDKVLSDLNEILDAAKADTGPEMRIVEACVSTLINCFEKISTVDAVEVVRCKDCKHWRRYIGVNGDACSFGECDAHDLEAVVETDEDDFCSYGERREVECK